MLYPTGLDLLACLTCLHLSKRRSFADDLSFGQKSMRDSKHVLNLPRRSCGTQTLLDYFRLQFISAKSYDLALRITCCLYMK